jgi:regulator of PEP synthase PpsR (kinase-PPPase family)
MNISRSVYIISDGTGETAAAMIRAALVQYPQFDVNIHRCKNARTENQIESLVFEAKEAEAFIAFTVVSPILREKITKLCLEKNTPFIDLLGPLLNSFDLFFGIKTDQFQAGILRNVDADYFKRIEAIEYTVKHDDGKVTKNLNSADIILVGISRTSKTPLSIFLSHKGWKVANVPLVLGNPLPEELFTVDQRKIVALTIDIDSLQKIRRNRLEKFGQDPGGEYASQEHILKELDYASELFKKNKKWPVFNVTDRALEETATEIIRVVSTRLGYPTGSLF